jgi:hypothetical protein
MLAPLLGLTIELSLERIVPGIEIGRRRLSNGVENPPFATVVATPRTRK